jgi:hypothetical protein
MRVLAALVLVAGCAPAAQEVVAREAARAAIRPVLAQTFPGVPLEPATDCILDNATTDELVTLASGAVAGPGPATAEVVARVAARPETLNCLATTGLPAILQGV